MSQPEKPSQQFSSFDLEVVAKIAAVILVHRKDRLTSPSARDEAADLAFRLLEACQIRIDSNAAIKRQEALPVNETNSLLDERKRESENLERQFGTLISFADGIRYITTQPTETKALPTYKRWRRFWLSGGQQKGGADGPLITEPSDKVGKQIEKELVARRKIGFPPGIAAEQHLDYKVWWEPRRRNRSTPSP